MMLMWKKKAYSIFVFLAAILFNAHMIIPHDHHQTGSDQCKTSLPFQNHSSHSGPVHCHIFNDITPEEAIINPSFTHLQNIQFIADSFSKESRLAFLFFSRISFFDNSKIPDKIKPSEFYSLRAPPALS